MEQPESPRHEDLESVTPTTVPAAKKKGKIATAKKSAAKAATEIATNTKAASKAAVNAVKPAFQKISSKTSSLVRKAKGLFNSV